MPINGDEFIKSMESFIGSNKQFIEKTDSLVRRLDILISNQNINAAKNGEQPTSTFIDKAQEDINKVESIFIDNVDKIIINKANIEGNFTQAPQQNLLSLTDQFSKKEDPIENLNEKVTLTNTILEETLKENKKSKKDDSIGTMLLGGIAAAIAALPALLATALGLVITDFLSKKLFEFLGRKEKEINKFVHNIPIVGSVTKHRLQQLSLSGDLNEDQVNQAISKGIITEAEGKEMLTVIKRRNDSFNIGQVPIIKNKPLPFDLPKGFLPEQEGQANVQSNNMVDIDKKIQEDQTSGKYDISKLKSMELLNLEAMFADAATSGTDLSINNAYRTLEQQQVEWDRYQQELKDFTAGIRTEEPIEAAKPGFSRHGIDAVDINNSKGIDKLGGDEYLKKYGFYRPLEKEPWHIEPIGSREGKSIFDDNQSVNIAGKDVKYERSPISQNNLANLPQPINSSNNNDILNKLTTLVDETIKQNNTLSVLANEITGSRDYTPTLNVQSDSR